MTKVHIFVKTGLKHSVYLKFYVQLKWNGKFLVSRFGVSTLRVAFNIKLNYRPVKIVHFMPINWLCAWRNVLAKAPPFSILMMCFTNQESKLFGKPSTNIEHCRMATMRYSLFDWNLMTLPTMERPNRDDAPTPLSSSSSGNHIVIWEMQACAKVCHMPLTTKVILATKLLHKHDVPKTSSVSNKWYENEMSTLPMCKLFNAFEQCYWMVLNSGSNIWNALLISFESFI